MLFLNNRHIKKYTLLGAPLLLSFNSIHADDHIMDNVVISAAGRVQQIENVQASVQVINNKDINQFAGHNLAEVLQHATGVQTRRSGSVSIRGFNSNQSLILIDGQRRTGGYGSSNLNQANINDIERIEVVRGPMSSLYGADALGGVVNIIRKHPGTGSPFSFQTTAGAAKEGRETIHSSTTFNIKKNNIGHVLNLEHKYQNPINFKDKNTTEERLGQQESYSINYRGHWQPNDEHSLLWNFEFLDLDSTRAALASEQPYTSFDKEQRYFYGLDYRLLIGAGELHVRANSGQTEGSANRSYPAPTETTTHTQHQTSATYQWLAKDQHYLSVGAGYIRDELELTINSQDSSRNNFFALAQDEWDLTDSLTLVLGARHDRIDSQHNVTTPRVSLGWNNEQGRARVGYGEGFRAPTLTEQYSHFNRGPRAVIQGNPNLKPEKSKSWEAMLGYSFKHLDVETIAHYSDVSDLINTSRIEDSSNPKTIYQYKNIDEAELYGVEANANISITDNLTIELGYDWLSAKDKATKNKLEERASHNYRVQLSYALNQWKLLLRNHYVRDYYGTSGECVRNCQAYDSNYNITDINIQHYFSNNIELAFGVNNILSKEEPDNFIARGSGVNDPGERYFYSKFGYQF